MTRSTVTDVAVRLILPSAVVFALHLLLVGHDRPGGGFIGGLVAGAAVALVFVAGGLDDVRRLLPFAPWTLLGGGLVVAGAVGVVPVALGESVLQFWKLEPELPLLGSFKISSALVFDIGVAGVVVGLVFMLFEALGEDEAPEGAAEEHRTSSEAEA